MSLLSIAVVTASLLTTVNAKATSAASCACDPSQLAACERIIELGEISINTQADTIDALSAQNHRLEQALLAAKEELDVKQAWYRKSEYVGPATFILGFVAGAYLVRAK